MIERHSESLDLPAEVLYDEPSQSQLLDSQLNFDFEKMQQNFKNEQAMTTFSGRNFTAEIDSSQAENELSRKFQKSDFEKLEARSLNKIYKNFDPTGYPA